MIEYTISSGNWGIATVNFAGTSIFVIPLRDSITDATPRACEPGGTDAAIISSNKFLIPFINSSSLEL